jgi:hypothetical protein
MAIIPTAISTAQQKATKKGQPVPPNILCAFRDEFQN